MKGKCAEGEKHISRKINVNIIRIFKYSNKISIVGSAKEVSHKTINCPQTYNQIQNLNDNKGTTNYESPKAIMCSWLLLIDKTMLVSQQFVFQSVSCIINYA
jgi:hypothetical protein